MRIKPVKKDEIKGTPTRAWNSTIIRQTGTEEQLSAIALEEPLFIEVNGRQVGVLMRLPGNEKELAAGYCISENIISDIDSILTINYCSSGLPVPGENQHDSINLSNRIQIQAQSDSVNYQAQEDFINVIRSGCGAVQLADEIETVPALSSKFKVKSSILLGLNEAMRKAQDSYKLSGGIHAAALFNKDGKLITLQEDIGRHNAIDKVIGFCLLRRLTLKDHILFTTGRASHEMVTKSIVAEIPVVISVSAVTELAVQIAQKSNVTLIGYLRGNRMNVYTHPWRILVD